MNKNLVAIIGAIVCLLICSVPRASAWWPYDGGGGGFWPNSAWPYGGDRRSGMSSYRAQEDALRGEGIQRADQQSQQLRADQQSEAARWGTDMQKWSAVVRQQNSLQTQLAENRRYDEMRQEYLAERDRPVAPDQQLKREKAWMDSIRKQVRVAYSDIFTPSWMNEHPVVNAPIQFRNPNPHHWWNPATWQALTGWVTGSWSEPIPYNYGQNIALKDGVIYLNGKQLAGAADYAAHAIAIASAGAQAMASPPEQRQEMQWMPLGVFALSPEAKGAPTIFVQLAVDKNGVIAGTYFDAATEQTQSIQGALERSSSRAAWSVADNKDTVLEAGVLNLTQDELPILVHFGTERSQRWLLVRMLPPR